MDRPRGTRKKKRPVETFFWTRACACVNTNGVHQDPVDGRVWLSATRLNQYAECPRRWAFWEIDRIRPPRNRGKSIGSDAHDATKEYFQKGTPPDLSKLAGRLAACAIPHLPPRDVATTEFEVVVDTGNPLFKFKGYVDGAVGSDVWDTKFYAATSRPFMKTFQKLLTDAQAILYPYARRAADGTASFVMHYVLRPRDEYGTPKWEHVGVRWDAASLEAGMRELEARAFQMLWYRLNARRANEVPHRAATACAGIGLKCEYAGSCHLHSPGAGLVPPWSLNRKPNHQEPII